jgi:hypothetical protein
LNGCKPQELPSNWHFPSIRAEVAYSSRSVHCRDVASGRKEFRFRGDIVVRSIIVLTLVLGFCMLCMTKFASRVKIASKLEVPVLACQIFIPAAQTPCSAQADHLQIHTSAFAEKIAYFVGTTPARVEDRTWSKPSAHCRTPPPASIHLSLQCAIQLDPPDYDLNLRCSNGCAASRPEPEYPFYDSWSCVRDQCSLGSKSLLLHDLTGNDISHRSRTRQGVRLSRMRYRETR